MAASPSGPVNGLPAGYSVESTLPPGYTLEQQQAPQPQSTLSKIGTGAGEALGDVWDAVKGMVTHPVSGGAVEAGQGVYEHIKESIPILKAYEDSRAKGKGVFESLTAANEEARRQSEAKDVLKKRVDEFKKNPGQESVRALGDAAAVAASIWAGGKLMPALGAEAGEAGAGEAAAGEAAAAEPAAAPKPAEGVVSKVTAPLRQNSVQPGLQQTIRDAMNTAAEEAGVEKPTAKSIGKTASNTADNIYAKSKEQYRVIDEATGGRVQRFSDRLKNIQRQLDGLTGTEEDVAQEGKLLKAQKETEEAMHEAFEDAKAKGVDPGIVDQASANFKRSQALYDLNHNIRMARSGGSPDILEAKAAAKNPEILDPEKLFKRVDALENSGRLQDALGETGARNLYKAVNDSLLQFRKVLKTQRLVKGAAKATGVGASLGGLKKLIE